MAANRCPNCDEILAAGGVDGLCPRCLLEQALGLRPAPGTSESDPLQRLRVREGVWEDLAAQRVDRPVAENGSSGLLTLEASVGALPRILLRESQSEAVTPVSRPSSDQIPSREPGTGKYQLLGEIARGGMGAVLKGRDTDLGRDLAVKVLLETHRDNPELVRRFVEEAQIGGQLQHPGIVPVYELGCFADRRPFFTMKLVKGQTLAALLRARPTPAHDRPRFLAIFEAVCQTMAYAHARGVIHRDLKPSNVMVGSFGEVQVMDWGLAKVLPVRTVIGRREAPTQPRRRPASQTARSGSDRHASHAGSVLGTPAYMPPEQARGEIDAVDERADVFALGAMLCEILTGHPPYSGRHACRNPRKASERRPGRGIPAARSPAGPTPS